MNKEFIICIPTYKRKWPTILSCIRLNQDLEFVMFVRKEDYDNGYYNEPQFKIDNLKFITIDNVEELGMTREKILQYAIDNNYKYCMQIDDSQFGLQDVSDKYRKLSEIIEYCIKRFKNDKYKDKAFAMNFCREAYYIRPYDQYFISQLCQTFILNCKVCKEHDLHFRNLNECGLEDLAFTIEAVDKGLVELTDTRFIRVGRPGAVRGEKGGCHDDDNENKYRELNIRRTNTIINYVKNNNNIKDKLLLEVSRDFFHLNLFYCRFNDVYARKKILKEKQLCQN